MWGEYSTVHRTGEALAFCGHSEVLHFKEVSTNLR